MNICSSDISLSGDQCEERGDTWLWAKSADQDRAARYSSQAGVRALQPGLDPFNNLLLYCSHPILKRGIKDNSIQLYTHFLLLETEMSGWVAHSSGCLQSQLSLHRLEFSLSYLILIFNRCVLCLLHQDDRGWWRHLRDISGLLSDES